MPPVPPKIASNLYLGRATARAPSGFACSHCGGVHLRTFSCVKCSAWVCYGHVHSHTYDADGKPLRQCYPRCQS